MTTASALAPDTPETGEGQRRERRGRGDRRRERGERPEGMPEAPAAEVAPGQGGETGGQPTDDAGQTPAGTEVAAEGQGNDRAPRERRSRDRYGRDRRERGPRDAAPAADETASAVASAEAGGDDAPVRSSYFTMPVPDAPAPVGDAAPAAPARAPQPPAEPVAAPVTARAATAPATASRGMPRVTPYQVSVDELNAVAQASGLEWVNSDPAKVAAVQAAIAAEPAPIRVPREPRPVVVIDEGPLVLVETRKDLRDMTLPFENR